MFNPIQFVKMFQGKNPQQFLKQMMKNNPYVGDNPIAKNVFEMAENGNVNGIEQLGRNIAKEKGIDFDKAFSDFKNQFHL